MKTDFLKKLLHLSGICILFFLLGVILLNLFGYFFNIRPISVISTMVEVNKYEVRSQLLMDAMDQVGVCSAKKAADVWANGLKMRSAAMQYSVMSKALKDEYARQLENSFPNWVTGMSSPWIEEYKTFKVNMSDDETYIFNLIFYTKTSTGPAGKYKATLTIAKEKDFYQIVKIETDPELQAYTGYNPVSQ